MRSLALAAALALGCGGAPPAPQVPKVAALNTAPGEVVDIEAALVADHVTVIDFWAAWCAACDKIDAMLAADIADAPAIVVRRVDVGEGATPVARAYDIGALPHLRIFDRQRRLRFVLVGNDAVRAGELARSLLAE